MSFELIQLRLGFANNSSSSHSLVVLPAPASDIGISHDSPIGDYGWEAFTLTDNEVKQDYLAQQIYQQISKSVGEEASVEYIKNILGVDVHALDSQGIDHQSAFLLPVEADGKTPHQEFIKSFSKWLSQEHVIILGGNDNDGEHPLSSQYDNFQLPYTPYDGGVPLIADFDEVYQVWTLFSKETGAKMRIRFNEGPPLPEHHANLPSSRPSLVDVKITDKCPFQCSYCYQASLPTGRHAPLSEIAHIASELGKSRVFEVALGGGEPTLHPDFIDILKVFRQHNVIPNFTTRNLAWLKNKNKAQEIYNLMGSFAVSVDSFEEVEKTWEIWEKFLKENNITTTWGEKPKLSFQVVVGAVPWAEIEKILNWTQTDKLVWNGPAITLLGYKDVGFGEQWRSEKPEVLQDQVKWVSRVQKLIKDHKYRNLKIRIDTALAESALDELTKIKITNKVFHTIEGSTSMYIDAVKKTMAPSSYARSDKFVPFDKNWLQNYQDFTSEMPLDSLNAKAPHGKSPQLG